MTAKQGWMTAGAVLVALALAAGIWYGVGLESASAQPPAPAATGAAPATAPAGAAPTGHEGHGHEVAMPEGATTSPAPAVPEGMAGVPGQVPPLQPSLTQATSKDINTRLQGLNGLAQIYGARADSGHPEIAQILRQAALRGETPEIRRAGISGLGARADENIELLLQATHTNDAETLEVILMYFTSAKPHPGVQARLLQLTRSPMVKVSTLAVDVLTKRWAKEGEAGIRQLVAALASSEGDLNAKAALQLINPVGRACVPAVTAALSTGSSALQRQGAAIVLGMLCGGKTKRQQEFTKAARSEFKFDLELAAPDERPLPVLVRRLAQDPSELVRESCAEALGNIGSAKAAAALAQAVSRDPSPHVRATAAQALVLIPGTTALPALARAVVSDRSPRVRQFAVTALGWMKDPRVTQPLIRATQDPDTQVRRLAAVQLGRLGTPEALSSLLALFKDQNEDVRWAAVIAVDNLPRKAKLADVQTRSALVEAADDVSPLVSQAAQTALQHLGVTQRSETHFRQGTPAA